MTHPDPPVDRATLEAWDDAHVWHPFTPHSVYRAEDPLLIVRGEGHHLIDADGNRYLDGVASIWCNAFGHGRPEVDRAVREQLDRIAHGTFLGHATPPGILLARRLAGLAPGDLDRVFFSDDGSTAVEVALKMAHQYWQQVDGGSRSGKTKFLALEHAYHGDTVGSVSVGGIGTFHGVFADLLFDVIRAPSPASYRRPEGVDRATREERVLEEVCRLIAAHADELAAVVMEPAFQGAAGMIVLPDGFLRRVREVTRAHDVLLVLDEVAAGMGRTGRMFACEHEDVVPDFLCLAKMLTNGYLPLAATLTTDRVFDAFLGPPEAGRTFYHGHTYTGNALGAAAALATLDIFEEEDVLAGLPAKIDHLASELARLRAHDHVGDIRQCGLAAGVELVRDRKTKEPFDPAERRGMGVCRHAREKGVFLRPLGDVIVCMPMLSFSTGELTQLVDAIAHGIERELGEAS